MKRNLIIIIALVVALLVTGCSGQATPSTPSGDTHESLQTPPSGSEIEEPNKTPQGSSPEEISNEEPEKTPAYLTDILVADNDEFSVTLQSITHQSYTVDLTFLLHNKSEYDIGLSTSSLFVNGCYIDGRFYETILAGKKAATTVCVYKEDLKAASIKSIDELIIPLYSTSNDGIDYNFEKTKVYPTGKTPDSIVRASRQPKAEDKILLDNEKYSFLVYGTQKTERGDLILQCYVENKSDDPIRLDWDDVAVNDFMCDTYFTVELDGHTCAYTEVRFYKESLSTVGSAPYKIETDIACYEGMSLLPDKLSTERVTVTVE